MKEQDQQIVDLEAKLKESEKDKQFYFFENGEKGLKIRELKQQLAEKDNKIKQLRLDLGMFKSVNEFINRYGIEKAREVLLQTEKTKNQDNISFAIKQLKKLRFELHFLHTDRCLKLIDEKIENQINGLKENKIND